MPYGVVWNCNDWGGWYDHIHPYEMIRDGSTWGSAFVSGFRVPLLVISPYTDKTTVSGSGVSTPNCLDPNVFYCHDFGSILAFVENNFGLGEIGAADSSSYADHFAPDNKGGNIPLSEFFTLGTKRTFYQIPIPTGSPTESYFTNYTGEVEPDNED